MCIVTVRPGMSRKAAVGSGMSSMAKVLLLPLLELAKTDGPDRQIRQMKLKSRTNKRMGPIFARVILI